MRVLFALPGLHRYDRGAEVAFISIAKELANAGDTVTLIGSGQARGDPPYRFLHAASMSRENFERFPKIPALRTEFAYEELTFVPALMRTYRPTDYDATLTCGYPFVNWTLRHPTWSGTRLPPTSLSPKTATGRPIRTVLSFDCLGARVWFAQILISMIETNLVGTAASSQMVWIAIACVRARPNASNSGFLLIGRLSL
jgi:hypothetical protein